MFSALPDNFIAQLLGIFSFALGAACFLQKDDKRFKYLHVALNVNHTLHFYLMDAFTSAVATAVSILRTLASIKISSPYAAYFFMMLMASIASFWATEWYHWLAVIGSCFGTYGMFCLHGIAMRVTMILGCLCWLSNNIIVGSIGGIMLESLILVSTLTTIFRLYRDQKKQQQSELNIQVN